MNKYFAFIYLLLFTIAFFGSFYLFTLPGASLPTVFWLNIPYLDKYIHMGIFFTLCFTAAIAWKVINRGKINLMMAIGIVLFFISYGIGIEYYQENYLEGRAFELLDIVADTLGCLLFLSWLVIGGFTKKSWSR